MQRWYSESHQLQQKSTACTLELRVLTDTRQAVIASSRPTLNISLFIVTSE